MTRTSSLFASAVLAGLLLSAPVVRADDWVVSNSTTLAPGCRMEQVAGPSDFLILVDASGSMCPYIQKITARLGTFVTGLQNKNITDARFAVAVFGGQPQLLQPFVANATYTAATLSAVACNRPGQEAGLEAIRMSLANNNGADFLKKCRDPYLASCTLSWRTSTASTPVSRSIIMATDEDSDMPVLSKYRMTGQSTSTAWCATTYQGSDQYCSDSSKFEPRFGNSGYYAKASQYFRANASAISLDQAYYNEIAQTAQAIADNNVILTMLIKSDSNANTVGPNSQWNQNSYYWNQTHKTADRKSDIDPLNIFTTIVQYGHPDLNVQNADFSNFDKYATYVSLRDHGLGQSLQAQVLNATNGVARVYKIQDLVSSGGDAMTDAFWRETIEMVQYCPPPRPTTIDQPTTSATTTTATISTTTELPVTTTTTIVPVVAETTEATTTEEPTTTVAPTTSQTTTTTTVDETTTVVAETTEITSTVEPTTTEATTVETTTTSESTTAVVQETTEVTTTVEPTTTEVTTIETTSTVEPTTVVEETTEVTTTTVVQETTEVTTSAEPTTTEVITTIETTTTVEPTTTVVEETTEVTTSVAPTTEATTVETTVEATTTVVPEATTEATTEAVETTTTVAPTTEATTVETTTTAEPVVETTTTAEPVVETTSTAEPAAETTTVETTHETTIEQTTIVQSTTTEVTTVETTHETTTVEPTATIIETTIESTVETTSVQPTPEPTTTTEVTTEAETTTVQPTPEPTTTTEVTTEAETTTVQPTPEPTTTTEVTTEAETTT
ncbi:hypothetical protein HDV00_011165, partial [Rhizophlyctis rosea]